MRINLGLEPGHLIQMSAPGNHFSLVWHGRDDEDCIDDKGVLQGVQGQHARGGNIGACCLLCQISDIFLNIL